MDRKFVELSGANPQEVKARIHGALPKDYILVGVTWQPGSYQLETVEGSGVTLEEAEGKAPAQVPTGTAVESKEIRQEPQRDKKRVQAQYEKQARGRVHLYRGGRIEKVTVEVKPRSGFLHIGERMGEYAIEYSLNAIVGLHYRTPARVAIVMEPAVAVLRALAVASYGRMPATANMFACRDYSGKVCELFKMSDGYVPPEVFARAAAELLLDRELPGSAYLIKGLAASELPGLEKVLTDSFTAGCCDERDLMAIATAVPELPSARCVIDGMIGFLRGSVQLCSPKKQGWDGYASNNRPAFSPKGCAIGILESFAKRTSTPAGDRERIGEAVAESRAKTLDGVRDKHQESGAAPL